MTIDTIDALITLLIGTIVRAIPVIADQTEADRAANLSIARTMIEAFDPADATEAAEAARAVAAHFAAMDSFARAAKPGVADEKAVRLRANALAAGRVFSTTLQNHRRQQRQLSAEHQRPHLPSRTAPMPAPASQVRHRAELPVQIPGLSDAVTQASQRAAWRGSTALAPVQPTVLAP
jgi:hypothetical protein